VSIGAPLLVVVGSGGVGKTTLAASLGIAAARDARDTLVMTFDPSLRLKDALGVGEEARYTEAAVAVGPELGATGSLDASLLDARHTFDRLVELYAPDAEARQRILDNRYYEHLSGSLSGVLEYMAVERLFEVAAEGRYQQVILDTPPTRQALDFLEAPERIIRFLDSSILKLAKRDWFDAEGRLKSASRFRFVGKRIEGFLDRILGLKFLREVVEFFQAFEPLYGGFRERAEEVRQLLRSERTRFLLVTGPGEERIPDTLFFARKLQEAGFRLAGVVVNRIHPRLPAEAPASMPQSGKKGARALAEGWELMHWLGERDERGLEALTTLLGEDNPLIQVPMMPQEPTDLPSLAALGEDVYDRLR
jgi:anion-transporting  ArsA/GET3 family ATPase